MLYSHLYLAGSQGPDTLQNKRPCQRRVVWLRVHVQRSQYVYTSSLAFNDSTDPSTGEELGQVAEMTVDDAKKAIQAAEEAFQSWSKTTAKAFLLLLWWR